jgi:TRAP-type C4-dicarboxylate transport system substrate-binding protein
MLKRTVAALLLLIASAAHAQKGPAIKLGTLAPRGSSFHQTLMQLGQKWRQAPGGGAELTIFTDGTQGSEVDMVRRMRFGQLHAGLLTAVGLAEIDESVEALQSMPMMFRSLEEVDYVRANLRAEVERRLNEKGFVVLFWADAGWVRFFSKDPVHRPDDLRKTKLYVTAGDTKSVDIMKAAGLQPIPLSPNDILPSLQTGLINAVPTVPTIALSGQFYSRAPNMLEINWAPLVGGLVVTRKKWDTLPVEAQRAMAQAAREAGEQMKARIRAENDQAVATMVKRGLKVNRLTPQTEAEWVRVAEQAWPRIRGAIVPPKFFDDVQRLLAQYRAQKK